MRPRAGFVPWPFPMAAGAALGIWLVSWLGWIGGLGGGVLVAALWCGWSAVAPAAGRWLAGDVRPRLQEARSWPPLAPVFWPLLVLALGLGAVRFEGYRQLTRHHAGLVGPWRGVATTWEGYFDGVTFLANSPARLRLAPVARMALPTGRLVVEATLEDAPGKRNPGGFDYRGHLSRRGIAAQLFVSEVVSATPVTTARERLRRGVTAGLPPDLAALMTAMTLGLRGDLGTLRDTFTASGLAHLLSLSGLHFGVLVAAAARLTVRLGPVRVYALMSLTLMFVALVGTAPSVVRAASMAMAALIGQATGAGRFEPWTVLSLSLVLGLMIAPQMLFDISFQLSYLALAGLLLFATPFTERLRPGPGAARQRPRFGRLWLGQVVVGGCGLSVAAQLPSLSLVAGSFGVIPLAGPLVNVVAVPLAAVAVPLGFAAGLVGLVAEPLAWLINRLTLVVARPITWLAAAGAEAPSLAWGEVTWLGHLCWASFMVAAALWVRGRLRSRRLLLVTLVAGGVSYAAGPERVAPDVWFFDVGQGDSVLVRLPGRYEVLIDAGGAPFSDDDVGRRVVLPALRALGVDELEVVVASHPDADHVEGLFSVIEEMPVGTLVTGPVWPDVVLDQALRARAAELGVPIHVATRGEKVVLGHPGLGATLEVLHPPADTTGSSTNEASVVLLFRYRGQAVALFTGDAGAPTEERLPAPHVAVLQVGHHGSRFSTSEHLLAATTPSVAVVSVGANNYGHPHPDVLGRLAAHSVTALTTQRHGAVRVDVGNGGMVTHLAAEAAPP